MCFICDGGTHEEFDEKVEDDIRVHGWSGIIVEPSASELRYAYTVGLEQSRGHPELVVVGDAPLTFPVLSNTAQYVMEGATILPGETLLTPAGVVTARTVHPSRSEAGRFAMLEHWAVLGHTPPGPPRRPLQLVLASLVPAGRDPATWRLDRPEPGARPHRRAAYRPGGRTGHHR